MDIFGDIPGSTVRGITGKWKRLGTAATRPQSGRRSADAIAEDFQTGINVSTKTVLAAGKENQVHIKVYVFKCIVYKVPAGIIVMRLNIFLLIVYI